MIKEKEIKTPSEHNNRLVLSWEGVFSCIGFEISDKFKDEIGEGSEGE